MGTPRAETEDSLKLRFQIELEFVQCLANPNYLNFLAQRGFLKDQAFINYLKYLEYWKEPEYARFLKYPMCLSFLDLIQYPEFRKELANQKCSKFVEDQVLLHWQHYIRKRTKLIGNVTGHNQQQQQQHHQQQQQHQQNTGSGGGGPQDSMFNSNFGGGMRHNYHA